jgi:hypothetical protein
MLVASSEGRNMCDKCKSLDRDIESSRRLQKIVDDPVAIALVAEAIADLEADKVALHPDEK